MQRELKFRAWGIDGDKPIQIHEWWSVRQAFDCWLYDERAILMQFIGMVDRNKKEIYEGDIVDVCRYETEEIYRMKIEDIRRLPQELFGSNVNWIEVVGNIYENKDLI